MKNNKNTIGFMSLWMLLLSYLLVGPAFAIDADNDGLSDYDESVFGLDLNNPDEDNDGMSDGMEVTLGVFLNPIGGRPTIDGISQFYFVLNQSSFYTMDWQPEKGQNGRATAAGFIPEDYFLLNNQFQEDTSVLSIGNISLLNQDVHTSQWTKGYYSVNTFSIKESPGSFIQPYDANNTPWDRTDDFLVPMVTTDGTTALTPSIADIPLSDSQISTTPSDWLYLDQKDLSTDLTLVMGGLTISRMLNPNWTLSITFSDCNTSLAGNFLLGMDPGLLAGTGAWNNGMATAGTYGELLSGIKTDPNLGSVQLGYKKLFSQGEIVTPVSATESVQLLELEYRPNGDDSEVYRMTVRPAMNIDYSVGDMSFSLSDQFRKMYYDTAQFGEFASATFGSSYLSAGARTLRAPKFFDALLGTIDYPASQGNLLAQQAMEWFFAGTNKDGSPTLVHDANGFVMNINFSSEYQANLALSLSEQYIGLYETGTTRSLKKDDSNMAMDFTLSNGDSPFFDWLFGGSIFSISVTDENLLKNLFPFVQYDLLYDNHMDWQGSEKAGAWNNITEIDTQMAGDAQLNGRPVTDFLSDFNIPNVLSDPYLSEISDAYSLIANNGFNGPDLDTLPGASTTFNFSDYFGQQKLVGLISKLEEFFGITVNDSDQQFLLDQFNAAFSVESFTYFPYSYDTNQDWTIGDFELLGAIDDWSAGDLGDFELLDFIDFWAFGSYCWDVLADSYKAGVPDAYGACQ